MNVDEVYEIVKLACAKNTAQGYISPDDFNRNINVAQRSFISYLIGQYQQYQAKRPIPIVALGDSQRVRTSLAPLVYEVFISVNTSTGIGDFPYGFIQVDAMWGQYGYYNIRFTEQDRLTSNVRSVIDTPTNDNGVYLIRHEGFQFFPPTIGDVRCSYIQDPPSISWGYTEVDGEPVYNSATSTDPVWDNIDMLEIIVRCLDLFGVNLQLGVVREYANQIKKQGQ